MNDAIELLNFKDAKPVISECIKARRDEALQVAFEIKEITDSFDNENAVAAVRSLKQIVAEVEKCRKAVKAPVLDLGRSIDEAAKTFLAAICDEEKRVMRLVNSYAAEQQRKAQEAERAKRAEQERLDREKAEAARKLEQAQTSQEATEARARVEEAVKAVAAVKAEKPEVEKAEGQSVRKQWAYEVLDVVAIYNARPDLVTLEPNRRAITDAVKSCQSIPGLRIFEEIKTVIRR